MARPSTPNLKPLRLLPAAAALMLATATIFMLAGPSPALATGAAASLARGRGLSGRGLHHSPGADAAAAMSAATVAAGTVTLMAGALAPPLEYIKNAMFGFRADELPALDLSPFRRHPAAAGTTDTGADDAAATNATAGAPTVGSGSVPGSPPPVAAAEAVLAEFDLDAFNSLQHIRVAHKLDVEPYLKHLGACIVKHHMEDVVGVLRLHNHFHPGPGEAVVARLDFGGDAHTNNTDTVIRARAELLDEAGRVIPHHLAFFPGAGSGSGSGSPAAGAGAGAGAGGAWQPLQFFESTPATAIMAERLGRLLASPAFLDDYAATLQALGVADALGLFVLYEDLVPGFEGGLNEDTFVASNTQLIAPVPDTHELSQAGITTWRFRTSSDRVITMACWCQCCYRIRHTHNH